MALTIRVIGYKGSLPAQEISARFDEQGGTIGRSPDNHLVLPDPEKFISRLHARIVFENGQYFIQDTSTGGTFLGPNDALLQHGQAALANGQKIRIGEYELVADLIGGQVERASVVEPVRRLELADSGLLESPFATAEKPAAPDFFSSFVDQPESSPFHDSFAAPKVADTSPAPALDDLDLGDLMSKLDSLPGAGALHTPELPTLPDDFFAEEAPSEPAAPMSATPSTFEAVFGQEAAQVEEEPEAWLEQASVQAAEEEPFADPFATSESRIETKEQLAPAFEIPRPGVGPAKPAVSSETAQVVPDVPVRSPSTEPASVAVAESELMRAFLAGAGVTDPNFLPAEQWPELMKTSGEILRSMVEGLMLVLRARAELKSQFRVAMTTMRSVNNNPLKFTPNVDDAIKLILAPTHPGFLSPSEAVREGFGDVMNHQMAMTAGIQAALADCLRSFDPELIEKAQGEGLMFQKKARCWEQYVERYPQLKAAAQEEFFGDAFVEAYEKQMSLLSRANKPQ